MSWNDFLLPTRPSMETRKYQTETGFKGKYIGIIPLFWDALAIHKKSQSFENKMEEMSLNSEITQIRTEKNIFLVQSIFYYLENQNKKFYPVYKYDDHHPFTHSNLKDCFSNWLDDLGYNDPQFRYIRIYKMKGFHLFVLLLKNPISNLKIGWKSQARLPLLHLKDGELVNSMMKVSQFHYEQQKKLKNINYKNNSSDLPILGYLVEDDQTFPFDITFPKVIATLSNVIDLDSKNNQDLYFQVNINENENKSFGQETFFEQTRKKIKLNQIK